MESENVKANGVGCCTGINGSHTGLCSGNGYDRIVCWCCGASFPSGWVAAWSPNGSRCMECSDGCDPDPAFATPCLRHRGQRLEDLRRPAEPIAPAPGAVSLSNITIPPAGRLTVLLAVVDASGTIHTMFTEVDPATFAHAPNFQYRILDPALAQLRMRVVPAVTGS